MERKLERKDLAGYFPYGLFTYVGTPHTEYSLIENLSNNLSVFHFKSNSGFEYTATIEDLKPLLYPLDALCKRYIYNGKEIIPIVELARIAKIPVKNNMYSIDTYSECVKYRHLDEDGLFAYHQERNAFVDIFNKQDCVVQNQYELFDYLHELKIDYRGLIDAGLAVSVYDLENNPYK